MKFLGIAAGIGSLVASANAFVQPTVTRTSVMAPTSLAKSTPTHSATLTKMSVFDDAMAEFKETYPQFAEFGWGPSVKAERWNGRHAMAGWVILILTGYAKAHGLIPNADVPLDFKQWGTLATTYGSATITTERATILAFHVHLLVGSAMATIAPLGQMDKLFLDKDEEDETPAGLIPPIQPGLTANAELLNGRLAMLGLVALVFVSLSYQIPVLDVVNIGLGKMLL